MQKFVGKLLNSRWPAIIWTCLIFVLLTVKLGALESMPMLGIPNFDKFVHAALFGILVFLWWRYLYGSRESEPAMAILIIIFILASGFGIGMEFYQKYFTSREFEIGDIYADATGAAISAFICSYIKK